jgi:hypothetical protein
MVKFPGHQKMLEDLEAEAATLAERLENVQQAIVSLRALDFNQHQKQQLLKRQLSKCQFSRRQLAGGARVPHAEEYRSLTGVTDAIRDILRAAGRPIEATEIRDELTGRGFTGPQYRNLRWKREQASRGRCEGLVHLDLDSAKQ